MDLAIQWMEMASFCLLFARGDWDERLFDLLFAFFYAPTTAGRWEFTRIWPNLLVLWCFPFCSRVYISDVLYFSHENAYYSHSYVLQDSHSPPSSDKVSRSSLYFVINPPAAAAADFPKPYVKKDLMLPPYVPSSYAPLLRMIAYTYLSRVITGSEDSWA